MIDLVRLSNVLSPPKPLNEICFASFVFLVSRDFVWLFLAICLQFVIVVFPDHTHLLFLV